MVTCRFADSLFFDSKKELEHIDYEIDFANIHLFPCIEFVLNIGHLGAMEFGVADAIALLMAVVF